MWPKDLSYFYAFPEPFALANPEVGWRVMVMTIVVLAIVVSLLWSRALLVSTMFFFIAILPTMQIVGFTSVIAANKYVYFPLVGLMMLPVILYKSITSSIGELRLRNTKYIILAVLIALVFCTSLCTRKMLRLWKNSVSLHTYQLGLDPGRARAHNDLAVALIKAGTESDDYLYHLKRAVKLAPHESDFRHNLAFGLARSGQVDAAIEELDVAIELYPNRIAILTLLSRLLAISSGSMDTVRALDLARQAAALTGHRNFAVLDTLAVAQAANAKFDLAVITAQKAMALADAVRQSQPSTEIARRLDLYQQGEPCIENPTMRTQIK